jgi:uncharacterized membrane protein YqhA
MNQILIIALFVLSIGFYMQFVEKLYYKADSEFMEWQAKEFSNILKDNNITHGWG